mmetsp:Transcript_65294/g.156051  ORF Transcript_65294/g.156051 Transcript_65294/m.156051 type:complete len:900 (+) Transcript_65294:106-2805(+)
MEGPNASEDEFIVIPIGPLDMSQPATTPEQGEDDEKAKLLVHPPWDDQAAKRLGKVVFSDNRWERGLTYLRESEPGWAVGSPERVAKARSLLRKGAETYGFWTLSDDALDGLVNQLLELEGQARKASPGLDEWMRSQKDLLDDGWPMSPDISERNARLNSKGTARGGSGPSSPRVGVFSPRSVRGSSAGEGDLGSATASHDEHARYSSADARYSSADARYSSAIDFQRSNTAASSRIAESERPSRIDVSRFSRCSVMSNDPEEPLGRRYGRKGLFHAMILVISAAYATDVVSNKYTDAIDMFSWPIYFARLGGLACVLLTAVLFLSMSRTLHAFLTRLLPRQGRGFWFTFLDSYKEIHIMAGKALLFYSILHTFAHSIGTVPGILQMDVAELNKLLGCAQEDPPYIAEWDLSFLHWPRCPLRESDKPKNFTEALFLTMPGCTGVLLLLVLLVIAYTSAPKFRSKSYDWFWTLHNLMLGVWPVLLFLHGSQGWIGVGIPLVILVVAIPLGFYSTSRIARILRYYLFVGKQVKILSATVRLGRDGYQGALTQLEVSPPPYLWWFRPGMYAFICMPEYKRFQWHPFTITSGKEDKTVNFLISGVGDWSQELARRCLRAAEGNGDLPIVALDGPFAAATQSATKKKVLVAVGAGVGITPFISLLSTLIAQLRTEEDEGSCRLVEAHFYWMTRNPTEFIFGWRLLQKWLDEEVLHSKIFIHLYTTAKDPAKDSSAFFFREAIKRQSSVDRKRFKEEFMPQWQAQQETCTPGPQFPWCWAEGGNEDLLWVQCPSWESEGVAESFHTIRTPEHLQSASSLEEAAGTSSSAQRMFPVIFGRPNFLQQIGSIGMARPTENIHVYVCGNDALVKDLQAVCQKCSQYAVRRSEDTKLPVQKYVVHFERFG